MRAIKKFGTGLRSIAEPWLHLQIVHTRCRAAPKSSNVEQIWPLPQRTVSVAQTSSREQTNTTDTTNVYRTVKDTMDVWDKFVVFSKTQILTFILGILMTAKAVHLGWSRDRDRKHRDWDHKLQNWDRDHGKLVSRPVFDQLLSKSISITKYKLHF